MSLDQKNIVWLVSYPKSGNTWLRIFLSNLLTASDSPVNINRIKYSLIASNRILFDHFSGTSASDLTPDEITNARPNIYRTLSANSISTVYLKVHDSWFLAPDGNPVFPDDITKKVIYLIRNPLDIAISYAHHINKSISFVAKIITTDGYIVSNKSDRLQSYLPEKIDSWKNHVLSWTKNSKLDLLLIRYEDLVNHPLRSFTKIAKFLSIDASQQKIVNSMRNSSFEELVFQEKEYGFTEKPISMRSFFRSGKINQGISYLDNDSYERILSETSSLLDEYGYEYQNELPRSKLTRYQNKIIY